MPRRAKRTATGAPAQSTAPVPGQRYGEGVRQQEMQQAMPTPATPGGIGPVPVPPVVAAAQQAAPARVAPNQAQTPPVDMNAIAQAMRAQVGLFNGTDRPNEPVTAGLPVGPGPGPEVTQLRRGSPVANTIADLARLIGDSYLAELAQRSQF